MGLFSFLVNECELFFLFSWRDWLATIVPICLFTAPLNINPPLHEAVWNGSSVFVWSILYTYSFNLFTQARSAEEDMLNKPDRPIPCGKISVRATWQRCVILWMLFFAAGLFNPQITTENIIYGIATLFLSFPGPGQHWIGKNLVAMSVMTAAMYSTSRKLMNAKAPNNWEHICAIAVWAGFVAPIQDFRDQMGDRHQGRRTLPLTFGDDVARYIAAFILLPTAFVFVYVLDLGKNAPWLLALMHTLLSYRVLALRESKADHDSYMFLLCIFCILAFLSSSQEIGLISQDSPLEARILNFFCERCTLVRSNHILYSNEFLDSVKST